MLQLEKTLLQMEGFEVVTSPILSSQAIPAQILQQMPQVVVMDVHLKQSNGFDLLHNIRQSPEFNNLKVILTSGMDFREQSLRAGADGFLLKPFMPEELVHTIRTSLGQ